jgi:hypothetical protein
VELLRDRRSLSMAEFVQPRVHAFAETGSGLAVSHHVNAGHRAFLVFWLHRYPSAGCSSHSFFSFFWNKSRVFDLTV